jgi:hypothetical protein
MRSSINRVEDNNGTEQAGVDETTLKCIKLAHHPCGGKVAEMVKFLKKYYGIRISRDRLAAIRTCSASPG